MTTTVLLTGATGALGPDVLHRLLRRGASVVVLLRPLDRAPEDRFASLREALPTWVPADRLSFVAGDLCLPGAGISAGDARRLAREVTHVLHLAADTRFTLPLDDARRANLDPTLQLLRLAEGFGRLRGFAFSSTLYVAGTRTGDVLEDELEETTFVNSYEQSKYEAERALRARMGDLPVMILRPGTIIGRAETGEAPSITAIHHAARLAHQGMVPMIPGDPEQTVELIDLESVADAVSQLLLDGFAGGRTFHLTAGPGQTLTLGQLIQESHRLFRELDPDWARRGIEPPALVSGETWELFERSVREAADPSFAGLLRGMSTFVPQLLHPKRFDRRNTEAALPHWKPPPVRAYYPRVLSWCLRTSWGREERAPAGLRTER